jgi:hypothetical protein
VLNSVQEKAALNTMKKNTVELLAALRFSTLKKLSIAYPKLTSASEIQRI